jgi:hypothetical protein
MLKFGKDVDFKDISNWKEQFLHLYLHLFLRLTEILYENYLPLILIILDKNSIRYKIDL